MIRILQVVTDMNRGGLETMLMNYYRCIDREKIQFDFLTHRSYKADYDDEIEALGGKIYHLPRLNPFSNSYKKALSEFLYSHSEYKIIHVHQDCLSSVVLKIAKQCGVPVRIAHSHSSSQNKDSKYPIKLFYKRFIAKYATHLMACSEAAGKWMFGNNSDFIVLNNAIDAEKYIYDESIRHKMRSEFGIAESELVLGHVGRFAYPKNHTFLIDIFKIVSEKIEAKLVLVGGGKLKAEIEDKVTNLGIKDKVIFTGIRSDVNKLLQAMDVFVFPSNYEGLPVTLVEAQAAGLPCFISDMVPIECKKTNLVKQLNLSSGAGYWADEILACKKERRNTFEEIKASGFDIKENAIWLTDYYQNLWT